MCPQRRWMAWVAVLTLAGGCATAESGSGSPPPTDPGAGAATTLAPGPDGLVPADEAAPTTTVPFAPTSTTSTPALRGLSTSCPVRRATANGPGRRVPASFGQAPPPETEVPPPTAPSPTEPPQPAESTTTTTLPTPASALADLLADERIEGDAVSVSVSIDGQGEVVTHEPDLPLRAASNQKLLTAAGALAYLDPTERLQTRLVGTGPVVAGVLHGDLVLVGGGDPTLGPLGPNSIDDLARQLGARGITRVSGRLLLDESRFDTVRTAPGWPDLWWEDMGSLSALSIDRNWYDLDGAFLADPQPANGTLMKFALAVHGVSVDGTTATASVSEGEVLATVSSPTITEIVNVMLVRSDNYYAEILVKEIGHRSTRAPGTTADGLAAIQRLFQGLCVTLDGIDADGSGLSYDNFRSSRELRSLLQASMTQPWGELLFAGLAVADGKSFGGRYQDPAVHGRMRAKGGSLDVARSLTGFTATASNRTVTFSVVINGPNVRDANAAIEDFVTKLAQSA